ncbi:MAG: hypothetical protein IT197_05910 [Acidimicrobiia bacterium]|nr:hypothetical protein [Acidimicrobiia bacterium]
MLRDGLGLVSLKDGCAPQGQCGCCTVLVDGVARVACVTPAERVAGREITTLEGLDPAERGGWSAAFLATGGSQCGFCTPGIVMRGAALARKGPWTPTDVDRALAAHLCRCTGWQTIHEAFDRMGGSPGSRGDDDAGSPAGGRDLRAAARRAEMEGGAPQAVGPEVPLGEGGFAADTAPDGALVAVPARPGPGAGIVEAAGSWWAVGGSVDEARAEARAAPGRRGTGGPTAPLPLPQRPAGGVRLATTWVEPAYLETDASWCRPGGDPASPLANGGAFGAKQASPAPAAARELADRLGRPVLALLSREDVVRMGPKRPPVSAAARFDGHRLGIEGSWIAPGPPCPFPGFIPPYRIEVESSWTPRAVPGPPVSTSLRAAGTAEQAVLMEGALDEAGAARADLVSEAAADVLLDTCVQVASGARAGARVAIDPRRGAVGSVAVRVAAGDPLDHVVLRSYAIGAVHMALGWVFTEALTVDPDDGTVHDLTVRSLGVVRARSMPPVEVTIVDDPGPPRASSSDAVFAAVAAAAWNAVARAEGARPEVFPAVGTRASRALGR